MVKDSPHNNKHYLYDSFIDINKWVSLLSPIIQRVGEYSDITTGSGSLDRAIGLALRSNTSLVTTLGAKARYK